jgi:hypothetical protein
LAKCSEDDLDDGITYAEQCFGDDDDETAEQPTITEMTE